MTLQSFLLSGGQESLAQLAKEFAGAELSILNRLMLAAVESGREASLWEEFQGLHRLTPGQLDALDCHLSDEERMELVAALALEILGRARRGLRNELVIPPNH